MLEGFGSGRVCFYALLATSLRGRNLAWFAASPFYFSGSHSVLAGLAKTVESSWHRNLRRRRQVVRQRLRNRTLSGFGRRTLKRAKQDLKFLQKHHTWNAEEYVTLFKPAMNWMCSHCQIQNQQTDYCQGCKYHWSQCWVSKSQRRSQSRKEKKAKAEAKSSGGQQAVETGEHANLELFSSNPPWVMTTPQTRTSRIVDVTEDKQDLGLPPQPVLPAPPPTADSMVDQLSESELKIMKSLQNVKDMGIELSDDQQQKLASLEARSKEAPPQKALTHGHINRMGKIKTKLQAAAAKLKNLDDEWTKFMKSTSAKVTYHAKLYQECRAQMMTVYNQRLEELNQITKEMQEASMTLLQETDRLDPLPEQPNVDEGLQRLQQVMAETAAEAVAEQTLVISDDEEMIQDTTTAGDKAPVKRTNFRGSPSPGRVANLNLKVKAEKEK